MNKRADFNTNVEQSAFWMPYTANRQFKKTPRLLVRAEGMHYWSDDGRQILDGCAGLWCVNAGHCRPKIVEAVRRQVGEMDFAPTFQMGHPIAFEFADRLAPLAPSGFSRGFFTNSGPQAAGILLIFDEVITGFGRLGAPFGSQRLGVVPDLFTTAKGMTNGTVPMGGVFVKDSVYDAFMQGPDGIELFHGYTYSGHPLACAAGLGTLDTYEEEGLLTRAAALEKHWEGAMHALKDAPNVVDIRNFGLMGAIELSPKASAPGSRGYTALVKCFEAGILIRYTGDTLAFSPPLIVEKAQIDQIFETVRKVLQTLD